jgi:general secretion pathway protein D
LTRRLATIVSTLLLLGVLLAPLPAMAKGVVLNFSDVDIVTMAKFISDLTGKNFVMDDRVKGKISVFSPGKLTPDEAFNLFTSVLELKGFTLSQVGKVYKIIPTPSAKQSGMKILTDGQRGPVNESYIAQVISLEHIPAQEAVAFLQPVVSKDGYISAFGPANMLLVVDSSLNIRKVQDIIHLIDSDQQREKAEVIYLKNSGADALSKVIQEWLKSRDKSVKPGQPQSSSGGLVVSDARLNALVVFGTDKDKDDVRSLVALLDVVPPTSTSKINVYYLENADATDVAKVMDAMLKGAPVPGQPNVANVANAGNQSPFEGGKITITPDKATNSLVVMASPADYQSIVNVIEKLDKRRRQVFVQAVIAEVSLDKLKDLGVQWGLLGAAADKNASVVGAYDPQGTLSQLATTLAALTAGGFAPALTASPANFGVILKALNSNGAVNVLSNPTIMTSDNKEAEIFVGENVPFVTSSTTYNTGVAQTSNIERKDTGITLKITPQISEGEYVKLDIYQEISAVKDALSRGAAADITTTKRSAKTSVVVKDKDTIVIGGLIQDSDTETVSKVPFLGDIPLLGWLFKTRSKERKKTNLLILLTPRIMKGAEEMAEVTGRQKETFGHEIKSDKPFDLKLGKEKIQ